ncbi:MAG: hypothetical protein LBN02_07075, partial [Oscillospiraceae bacterium]|nr:hypothetical protein [Oscillospiraceae bacterium]
MPSSPLLSFCTVFVIQSEAKNLMHTPLPTPVILSLRRIPLILRATYVAGYALRSTHLSALAARRYFPSGESNQSPLEGTHRALLASVRRENGSGG